MSIPNLSFWKPEIIPPFGSKDIITGDLLSIGHVNDVLDKLNGINRLQRLPTKVKDLLISPTLIRYFWDVDDGVTVILDSRSFEADEVKMILVASLVHDKVFYRLYIQLFELFDITLLDQYGQFVTPKDFKKYFLK